MVLLALPFLSKAQTAVFQQSVAGETSFLPIFKENYRPQFGVSIVAGIQNNQNFDKSANVFGIDISLQCPLLCTSKNYIRQQISFIKQDGKDIQSLAIELNPQYRLIATPSFELGVGPSLGVVFAEVVDDKNTAFTYGLGASMAYHIGSMFFTIESRYGLTGNVDFVNSNDNLTNSNNLNNLRTVFKIGYKI